MKTPNHLKQMAADIRELVKACGPTEKIEAQNQTLCSTHGDVDWYQILGAKIYRNTVYVQGMDGKWFMLREYRLSKVPAASPVKEAMNQFPAEFGLKAFPGRKFRISEQKSYVGDYPAPGTMNLYTQGLMPDGTWMDFCKCTPAELQSQMVELEQPKPAALPEYWLAEFGAKFQPPAEVLALLATSDGTITDDSWHNDVTPHLGFYPKADDRGMREAEVELWWDAVKPEDREYEKASRFCVTFHRDLDDPETFCTDDITEAMKAFEDFKLKAQVNQ